MAKKKNEDLTYIPTTDSNSAILGKLQGPCADFINPTRNGRKYSKNLWKKVFNDDIVKETFEAGGFFGELGHPEDRSEIDMEKIAICMPEPPKENDKGELIATFDILDTPNGRILKTLVDYGYKIGISSRGTGDVYSDIDGTETVDEDTYDFVCFDAVLLPAVKTARLSPVTESLDKKKTLQESLKEQFNKATEDEKKVMKETLETLELDEGIDDSDILSNVITQFGVVEEPFFGPTFILPNGKLLDLTNEKHHSAVEKFLIDNDLSTYEFVETAGSPSLADLGCIRVDALKYYIALSNTQPTREQYNSLLVWLDYLMTVSKSVEVITPDDQHIVYSFNDYIPDIIVDRIRRFYSSGTLYEKLNQRHAKNFLYKRNKLGEGIESASIETEDQIIKIEIEDKESNTEELEDTSNLPLEGDYIDELEISDKEILDEPEEAEDFGSEEIVENLQKTLKKNYDLERLVEELQTKLSVSNAKESKLNEEIKKYKDLSITLSEKTKSIKTLNESISQLETRVQRQQNRIVELKERLKNSSNESNNLNETIMSKDETIKSLNDKITNLQSSLDSSSNLIEQYSNKLNKAKELVEKYKKASQVASEHYIEVKAKSYGLSKDQIKDRLSESFTLKDVDNLCESLSSHKLRVSKLPFELNKNIRVTTDSPNEPLFGNKSFDDDVDESLLRLANL